MTIFQRPALTAEEEAKANDLAKIIVLAQADRYLKIKMVREIIAENIRCGKEINIHRLQLGYDPLPIHEPKF